MVKGLEAYDVSLWSRLLEAFLLTQIECVVPQCVSTTVCIDSCAVVSGTLPSLLSLYVRYNVWMAYTSAMDAISSGDVDDV